MTGTLSVDIRQSVAVTIGPQGSAADIELKLGEGEWTYFDPGKVLSTKGSIELFPESALTLYVATWSLPARAASPCGASPIAVALSLARRERNARVGGAPTVYCGPEAKGTRARTFGLSGDLPPP